MTDPHFINWMRSSGLSKFKKLYGTINQKLEKGMYTVIIKNNWNAKEYGSMKSFILSTIDEDGIGM